MLTSATYTDSYTLLGPKWGLGIPRTSGGTVTWSIAGFNYPDRSNFDSFLSSFLPIGFDNEIRAAFDVWEAVADIDFLEVADSATADIRLGGITIDGRGSTIGQASYTFIGSVLQTADVFFDSAENWTIGTSGISIFTVAAHEIGHAIGLGHAEETLALMNAMSSNLQNLQADDIAGVRAIYGPRDDFAGDAGTTGAVAANGTASGEIEYAGDSDWFRIELAAGQTYTFDLAGNPVGIGRLADPVLRLVTSSGVVVATDDNGGDGLNARIVFSPTVSGTYFLEADANAGETGSYSVTAMLESQTVFRFFNTQNGAHFYTASEAERDSVTASLPDFSFEGAAFGVLGIDTTDTMPVYRFYNTQTGAHFYTISQAERDVVENTLPQYLFEGPAYYAYPVEADGTTPLFRFFNSAVGNHFYTVSEAERDYVIDTFDTFSFEGIAYYVEML